MNAGRDWNAVGKAVTARKSELGLKQVVLAKKAKLSTTKVRELERGKGGNYRPETLRNLSLALSWPADALERYADHNDPPPVEQPRTNIDGARILDNLHALREDMLTQFDEIERQIREGGTGPQDR